MADSVNQCIFTQVLLEEVDEQEEQHEEQNDMGQVPDPKIGFLLEKIPSTVFVTGS